MDNTAGKSPNPQRIVSDFELSGADLRMLMSIGRPEGPARARTLAGGCSCSCPRVKS
jgi:hypothetical protein